MKKIYLLILAAAFMLPYTINAKNSEKEAKVTELTSSNYKTETSKGVVLVDFWASWCGPCRQIAPELEKLAQDKDANIKVGKLNVDKFKAFATNKGIRSIPTLILYKDGKEITRILGVYSKEELKNKISEALK